MFSLKALGLSVAGSIGAAVAPPGLTELERLGGFALLVPIVYFLTWRSEKASDRNAKSVDGLRVAMEQNREAILVQTEVLRQQSTTLGEMRERGVCIAHTMGHDTPDTDAKRKPRRVVSMGDDHAASPPRDRSRKADAVQNGEPLGQ